MERPGSGPSGDRRPRVRPLVVLSAAVLAAGALLHVVAGYSGGDGSEHALGSDDAYITFRYARNLVAGDGLVYNPGERVEGFSNLLWVGVSAVALLFVPDEAIYLPVSFLNVLLLLAAAALFYRRSAAAWTPPAGTPAAGTPGRAGVALLLLAFCPVLWLWAASGLETPLVLALQVALWIAVERAGSAADGGRTAAVALALGLLVLARADGFVWVAVTLAFFLLHGRRRTATRVALATAPVIAALFAGRYAYYGELLPNTYHAKVGEPLWVRIRHGGEQLWEVAMGSGLLPYLLAAVLSAAAVLGARGAPWRERLRLPFPTFLAGCLLLYWLWIGGDHFGERFLLVLFPIGIALVLELFADLDRRRRAFLVALLLALQLRPLTEDPRFDYRRQRYDCWVTLGRFLEDRYPGIAGGGPLLAVDAAGKIPYFSGLRTLDMLGLTDPHIARVEPRAPWIAAGHNKRDPAYVLAREPDLIATWVQPDLDLAVGLERPLYEGAGYRLAWMLNTSKESRPADVVDVRGRSDGEKVLLLSRGYRYGVLVRDAAGR